jgi:hypothetical protein
VLTTKLVGIFQRGTFFQWENIVDSVHHPWTVGGTNPGWTADGASAVARQRLASRPLRSKGAHQRERNRERGTQGSWPGLTEARAAVGMRHDGGDKRQRLELGVRELEREGKRVGEGRGSSSPFIGLLGGRGGRDRRGGSSKWCPQWSHYQSEAGGGNAAE